MLHMPIETDDHVTVPTFLAPARSRPSRRAAVDYRVEALARSAPWGGGLGLLCGAAVLWGLADRIPPALLIGWALALVAVNVIVVRSRRGAATRSATAFRRRPAWTVAEALLQAGLWIVLPATTFPAQPAATQTLLGAAMATMMAGAFLLAIVPVAAVVWTFVIAGGLVWALHTQGDAVLASGLALLSIHAAMVIAGCLTIARLLGRQAGATARERARADNVARLLAEYEEQGGGWLWQTDASHRITYASPRLCDAFGRSTTQLIGLSLPLLLGCDAALGRAVGTHTSFTGLELSVETRSGKRWVQLSASPIVGLDGGFAGYRGVGTDVTEVRRAEERIRRVALVDDLTGLPNRQQVRSLLDQALAAVGAGEQAALLFLDLDGFKPVNDRLGHPVGDAVLRQVAERLAANVAIAGHVGRLGGDEFAVVLPRVTGRWEAEALGARLIAAVAEPVEVAGIAVTVGLSIGCVIAPIDGTAVDDLLEKADIALYQAKSRGRGRLTSFDTTMQRDAEARTALERDLRHALVRGELRLEYQPVIDVQAQSILGFEALLRWAHPVRGLVPPLIFLPVAEECGLIGGIAEWVIRTACADAAGWPGDGFVSINLSRAQVAMPGLAGIVGEALMASRLSPARLELEVTESVFQGVDPIPLDVLRRLRALGVGIALDDFGSGHASLGYLNRAIFHTLKLDGNFVREAGRKGETLAVIRAIVALATSFRMAVTAEGIESFDDFQRMRELGCQRVQGYLFGRPAPDAEIRALLTPRTQVQAAE